MEKVNKSFPIRQRGIRAPVVFTFNVLLNHYLAFGSTHYKTVQKIIQKQNRVDNFILMPNVTNVSMDIEHRAHLITRQLQALSEKTGSHHFHLVTHSFCGVDCRAAISMYGANKHVLSLSTVCTPHKGMKLIDEIIKKPKEAQIEYVDKAFEAVGMSQKNSMEFTTLNMQDFNDVATDAPNVDYYSIGAQKQKLQCSEMLQYSHDKITEGLINLRNDGLVRPEEAEWGRYLVTYEQDHLEMAGFNAPAYVPMSCYSLIVDNIRLTEIKNNPRDAKKYGVDHLFQNGEQKSASATQ